MISADMRIEAGIGAGEPLTVYAFDVDHTLDVSGGPVSLNALVELAVKGHIVGICGNWALITHMHGAGVFGRPAWWPHWKVVCSFFGPIDVAKRTMLAQIKRYVPAARYVMVGNDPAHFGASNDVAEAAAAEWEFIREHDFARGAR